MVEGGGLGGRVHGRLVGQVRGAGFDPYGRGVAYGRDRPDLVLGLLLESGLG